MGVEGLKNYKLFIQIVWTFLYGEGVFISNVQTVESSNCKETFEGFELKLYLLVFAIFPLKRPLKKDIVTSLYIV